MGVGKSSVGRHLAHLLGIKKIDLDAEIESAQGRSIADLIDTDGEEKFREAESSALRSVILQFKPGVLSLGGGTWTIAENRELIRSAGYQVIWLVSSFEHCWINIKF